MPKLVIDAAMDAALNHVKGKEASPGLTLCVCAGEPPNRAAAVTGGGNHLTQHTILTNGNDLTIANGAVSGRQLTIAEQADIAVVNSGAATYVVIVDDTNILLQTTCASTALVDTGTVTVQAWIWNIEDAA